MKRFFTENMKRILRVLIPMNSYLSYTYARQREDTEYNLNQDYSLKRARSILFRQRQESARSIFQRLGLQPWMNRCTRSDINV